MTTLDQLELFRPNPQAAILERIKHQRDSWECCWGWPGPKVGGLISFLTCSLTPLTPGMTNTVGASSYVYMTPARVLELTDTTVRVRSVATMWKQIQIKPARGKPYWGASNEREPYELLCGKEFIAHLYDIWPCYHDETISEDGINVVTIKVPHPSQQ